MAARGTRKLLFSAYGVNDSNTLFFLNKNIVFPGEDKYPYFSVPLLG